MKFLSVTFKLLMVLFFISLSACGGGGGNNNSGNTTQTGDTTPPADVSNVTSASNSEGSASLSWINPTDTDFAGVMIRRSSSGFPQSATDGELVYEGMAETFEDSGLYGIEWCYSIFSYDNAQPINYSTPQTFSVTPIDTTAPTIVQQQPAPAATNVNYQSNVTIKFQEILDPASIINSISLCYEYQTTQSIPYPPYYQTITKCNPVSGSTNFDSQNMSLVFTQAGGKFLFNRVYRVTLNAGISDITGNSTTTSSSWKFTTEADSYPPIVTGTTPIDGEVEVPVSTQVQINFNEVIDNTTVSLSTVTLSGM
ncbi:Ig-like domain-containing protein, partial [Candidatus Pacearchaeota archaeon]|nr:Ig-like domain-containing protein [Candidatus Pacearchaeota archaeon]